MNQNLYDYKELTLIKNEFEVIVSLFEKIKPVLPTDFVSEVEEVVRKLKFSS